MNKNEQLLECLHDLIVLEHILREDPLSPKQRIQMESLRAKKTAERDHIITDLLFKSIGQRLLCYSHMSLDEIKMKIYNRYEQEGLTAAEIGDMMGVTIRTIQTYRKGIKYENQEEIITA